LHQVLQQKPGDDKQFEEINGWFCFKIL